jgi:inorganic pyrophosphatase
MPDEGSVSFVCEIPKFERAKMECITTLPHNPIM